MTEPRYGIGTIIVMLKHCEEISQMMWIRLGKLSETEKRVGSYDLSALSTMALGVSEEVRAANIATQKLVAKLMKDQQKEEDDD